MKRILSVLLSVLMTAILLAGCGSTPTASSQTGTTAGQAGTTGAGPTEPQDIVELVVQICTLTEPGEGFYEMEAELNEMLERDLGVHVTFERTDIVQVTTDASLALSSGEQMDVIISFGTGAQTWESGMCIPLDDLAAQYGQDILEQSGDYIEMCKIDGELFGISVLWLNADGHGYEMKKSFADKYGFTRDVNKLYTLDEIEEMFEIIDEGEEQNVLMQITTSTSSMTLNSHIAFDSFTQVNPIYGTLILASDKYAPTQVVNLIATEEYAYYAQKMYEWAQKGWISADAAVTTDTPDEILTRDDTVGFFAYGSFDDRLEQVVAWADEVVVFNTQPAGKAGSLAGMMWHITPTCEHPEKAMEFLNYFFKNPEAHTLVQYGREGVEWEVVEREGDNTLIRWLAENPVDLPHYIAYPWLGNQARLPVFEPNPIDMNQIKLDIEANIPDAYTSPALGYVFDTSEFSAEIAAISSVMDQYVATINAGAVDPAVSLPEFLRALESAGINEVIAANQQQLDAFIAQKG